jgi:hypothetical protein
MKNKGKLPEEVLNYTSLILLPYLANSLAECRISSEELFILTYINNSGRALHGTGKIILREEITTPLKKLFRESDPQISKTIYELCNRGLLTLIRLNDEEKEVLYGTMKGRKAALLLLEPGLDKIDEFTDKLNRGILEITNHLSERSYNLLTKALKMFAQHAVISKD